MQIVELDPTLAPDAVALWHVCGLTRPWNDPLADLERALEGPASTVLGAVEAGRLVGTVMVGHDGHRGWVYYLAVDPELRRQGLGRALMQSAESWLREQGTPKVQLMVRADNEAVLAFYERLGYADQRVAVLGRFFNEDAQSLRDGGTSA